MDTVVSFGGLQIHVFDQDEQTHISDNFNDLVTRTSRMVGVSGGFDELGSGPAPRSVGNVRLEGWIQAETRVQMSENLRLVGLMSSFGVGQLIKQPMDTSLDTMYCEARVNTINYVQSAVRLPRQQIKVTANFNVATPGWIGTALNSEFSPVGVTNDYSIVTGGNAFIYPTITIEIPGGKSATNVRIQRIVNAVVVDEVRYDDTLAATNVLIINTQEKSITLNAVDAYSSVFTFQNAGWFHLLPDYDNTIRVLMDNVGDEAVVDFDYANVYV